MAPASARMMLRTSNGTYFSAKRPWRQCLTSSKQSLTFADGVGKNRVGRSNARANDERLEEREVGDERPNKESGHEPGASHDRDKQDEQTESVPPAICLRKRDTGEQDLDGNDDAGNLERKRLELVLVIAYPAEWIEYVCTDRPKGDADE